MPDVIITIQNQSISSTQQGGLVADQILRAVGEGHPTPYYEEADEDGLFEREWDTQATTVHMTLEEFLTLASGQVL